VNLSGLKNKKDHSMSKKKPCENHGCRKGKGFLALEINQELGEPKGTKEI